MPRRLPAPPPGAPGPSVPGPSPGSPPPEEPVGPRDDDDDEPSDTFDESEEEDPALFRPDAWPDDDDEPTIPRGLADPDLDELLPIEEVGDDGVEDDVDVPDPDEVPLEDDLADLDAPDDTEVPIIPWTIEVLVDGRPVTGRVDPSLEQTTWLRAAGGEPGEREVTLAIAGKRVRARVRTVPADQEGLLVGRDVLSGRFLLRP